MRATNRIRRSNPLWVLVLAALAGCQNTPRNGQALPNPTDAVQFGGYTNNKNMTVSLQARDFRITTPTFRTLATTPSSNTASLDAVGGKWYAYSRSVAIPFGRAASQLQHWLSASTIAGQRRIKAETRSFTSTEGAYYSFDMADNDCIQAHESEGGLGIISACDSEGERAAAVFVNCGKRGQACCLGLNIFDSVACDAGTLCDANSKCTIESGGLNQPCTSGSLCDARTDGHLLRCIPGPSVTPSAGTCRDLTVERTPVVTADLIVHTCNQANAQSVADRYVGIGDVGFQVNAENRSLPRTNMQWLSRPHEVVAQNESNTYGLRIDGLNTLADITRLSLNLAGINRSDGWCVDNVRLDVNGQTVFQKALTPTWLGGDTSVLSITVATQEELRAAYANLVSKDHCKLPTKISTGQIRRQVEAVLGDMMTRARVGDTLSVPQALSLQMRWGTNGDVNVVNVGDGLHIDVTMHARELYTPIHFSGYATFALVVRPDCDSDVNQFRSNGLIQKCSTDYVADIGVGRTTVDLDDEFNGFFDTFIPVDEVSDVIATAGATFLVESVVSDTVNFGSYFARSEDQICARPEANGTLCDAGGELCGCAGMDFQDDGVHLNWSNFGPFRIDLPGLDPNLACLR